ncbi:ethanolamine ammonia-lyase, light subunit [Leptospira broomii serovar Hurstbridge str. 5399]|uniref:Ethanolamine ammonia-lyase small subunit n=1 Tax=Leptospira broomii serovar Hurstbridge str. 5399 TaxID=1049789 RepID=T0F3L3_9LEPT|nr:ethanolamine ammonia-lyase subunit EutC [Leptospira broomii]EQA45690.1 ethanolamine ammonia-lyase, light subunit [Leptospira broomii serovar Hurstbridge str. 5399]
MPPLKDWKKMTSARIGLSRSGGSLSTKDLLQFRLDHARAKDAVLLEPKFGELLTELDHIGKKYGIEAVPAESRAKDRGEYLLRPDLGRSLSEPSHGELQGRKGSYDLVLVCADGLSAKAIDSNLLPFLESLLPKLKDWKLGPLVLTRLGRVAIGDEIGQCLGAKAVVVIIGERPGLSSADSLGVYLTYDPTVGKTDESRNCVSNIRPGGLEFEAASAKTHYLLEEALKRKLSGVELKDEMSPSFFIKGETKQLD